MLNFINPKDPLVTEDEMYSFYPKVVDKRGKDLTGIKFGKLQVLYKTESRKVGNQTKPFWVCKCENCGNIVVRRSDHLYRLENNISTCGCPNIIDISNQKFGKLTAIEPYKYDNHNGWIWKCKCDCGGTSYTSYCSLTKGYTYSCGCYRIEQLTKLSSQGSKGERAIIEILEQNNIQYERQKIYPKLKDKNFLPYDFYLPLYNTLIEYDGQQHFFCKNSWWDTEEQYNITKKHDLIKNNFALENNIILIRIPYYILEQLTIKDLLPNSSKYIINKK